MGKLSHIDESGAARMVDVSDKDVTSRTAVAAGEIVMQPQTLEMILSGDAPKGDVIAASRLAGIMAAKQTSSLIPLCHPLAISSINVDFTPDRERNKIIIEATVKTTGRTGVEMEALTAVSIAALTLYDMCKAVDKGMTIGAIRLREKTGGKSGTYKAE